MRAHAVTLGATGHRNGEVLLAGAEFPGRPVRGRSGGWRNGAGPRPAGREAEHRLSAGEEQVETLFVLFTPRRRSLRARLRRVDPHAGGATQVGLGLVPLLAGRSRGWLLASSPESVRCGIPAGRAPSTRCVESGTGARQGWGWAAFLAPSPIWMGRFGRTCLAQFSSWPGRWLRMLRPLPPQGAWAPSKRAWARRGSFLRRSASLCIYPSGQLRFCRRRSFAGISSACR